MIGQRVMYDELNVRCCQFNAADLSKSFDVEVIEQNIASLQLGKIVQRNVFRTLLYPAVNFINCCIVIHLKGSDVAVFAREISGFLIGCPLHTVDISDLNSAGC